MFSSDGTVVSASAAPHCGGGGAREREMEREGGERESFGACNTHLQIGRSKM